MMDDEHPVLNSSFRVHHSSLIKPRVPKRPRRFQSSQRIAMIIGKAERLKRALLWLPAKLYELAVRLRVAAYETDYL